jgi:hypothetical protein
MVVFVGPSWAEKMWQKLVKPSAEKGGGFFRFREQLKYPPRISD